MTQVTNLNRFRKDRARAEKRATADANAAKHGMTKAERLRLAREAEKARKHLDGLKFEDE